MVWFAFLQDWAPGRWTSFHHYHFVCFSAIQEEAGYSTCCCSSLGCIILSGNVTFSLLVLFQNCFHFFSYLDANQRWFLSNCGRFEASRSQSKNFLLRLMFQNDFKRLFKWIRYINYFSFWTSQAHDVGGYFVLFVVDKNRKLKKSPWPVLNNLLLVLVVVLEVLVLVLVLQAVVGLIES